MDILVDENIPLMTVAGLRELGHDVKDVRGTGQQGLPDANLWTLGLAEERMLITTDKGFTERRRDRHKIHNAVLLAMGRFAERQWSGLLVVMRDQTMSVSRQNP
jgi:predicted nuclease of predicted toxin-antitoxin system